MTAVTATETATGRRGQLALALQEAFTVAVRLRANRQVAASADAFRAQIKQLLASTDRDARRMGYDGDTARLAIYAYIAFLDESVLNSAQPMFSGWSQQPLQEEVFGDHVAGENFFRHLADLLARQDSEDLADLLEVYLLCLLLGFRGRYGANPGALHGITVSVQDKIRRIRGGGTLPFAPAWALPVNESAPAGRDPWMPKLFIALAVTAALALVVWVVARFLLGGAAGDLQTLVNGLAQS
jgi:type VI secretion system protein ImpK